MIKEIKEALDKATPRWHDNGNEIVSMDNPRVGIGGFLTEEDNHLAANAPEWLRYLIGAVEKETKRADFWQQQQLELRKANMKLLELIGGFESVLKDISTDGIAVEEATKEELIDFITGVKRKVDEALGRTYHP